MINDLQNWLLNSDIRIKNGDYSGGFYGWKNMIEVNDINKFPFIYNEVTGYSFSSFSHIYSEFKNSQCLIAMKESLEYIKKNLNENNLLNTGKRTNKDFKEKGEIENQIYLFDNGIIMSGLINYYKVIKDQEICNIAKEMGDSLIKYFFNGYNISNALLDVDLLPIDYGLEKWSTKIGSYHAKVGIGFNDLYNITRNKKYLIICKNICDFAVGLQNYDGSFLNNPGKFNNIFLHPHLYACEGLTYVGYAQKNKEWLISGLKGIEWTLSKLTTNGGVPRSNIDNTDQADCTSQLLRLLLLYYKDLNKYLKIPNENIDNAINLLYNRIIDFFIESEGAIKYTNHSNFVCTWCTMFVLQALILLYKKSNQETNLTEFFV